MVSLHTDQPDFARLSPYDPTAHPGYIIANLGCEHYYVLSSINSSGKPLDVGVVLSAPNSPTASCIKNMPRVALISVF